MFGMVFLAALLANIVLIGIFACIGYFIYKKNKDKISSLISNIQEKVTDVSGGINLVASTVFNVKDKFEKFEFTFDNLSGSISSISNALEELKNKFNKLPF